MSSSAWDSTCQFLAVGDKATKTTRQLIYRSYDMLFKTPRADGRNALENTTLDSDEVSSNHALGRQNQPYV